MAKLDAFSQRRLLKFIEDHRSGSGQLPTLSDLAAAGFEKAMIQSAVKSGLLEELYVTLTSGSIVKGYKAKVS